MFVTSFFSISLPPDHQITSEAQLSATSASGKDNVTIAVARGGTEVFAFGDFGFGQNFKKNLHINKKRCTMFHENICILFFLSV